MITDEALRLRYIRGARLIGVLPAPAGRHGLGGLQLQLINASATLTVTGAAFVDASYEGDLLALAGVPFVVGRESAVQYNESLAGRTSVGNLRIWLFLASSKKKRESEA